MTYSQLGSCYKWRNRQKPKRKFKAPAFKGSPHKKAIIYKILQCLHVSQILLGVLLQKYA